MIDHERVRIIAHTRMRGGRVCIAAMSLQNGRLLRLMDASGRSFHEGVQYALDTQWDIEFVPKTGVELPHVEDVCVRSARPLPPLGRNQVRAVYAHVLTRSPDTLFNGLLHHEPAR